ncbi:PLP-dependent cysteine synthase family protein [Egicoccus halophilus]|uniref:Cysteine synthase n=1 Tax=Egicoccus halophilus TaxID=1670830 RepID=A0A8J3ESS0_9ACTN|nr:PLP-dependent cysteine synthase family protein [Egicoccus halophilus]GGI08024.1 cysteine synthase [Egicoccus halophilus]
MRFDDVSQAIGNTPLVGLPRLSPDGYRIYLKLEGHNPTGSVKDRVAKYLIEQAERAGELVPGQRVLEPTSGNTGIALAAVCKVKGYPLTCVMPENTSEERRQLLTMFGVELVFSPASEGSNGSVRLARELAAADPALFMPFQYGNPANALAHYETTAPEILADLPEVTAFVAGLGTGGTVTGVGRRLKRHDPDIKVFAAEPEYGDLVYGLRNLDEGYVPEVLDQSVLDSRIKVDSLKALQYTRELAEVEGIFAGVSTGASLAVAVRVCKRLPAGSTVVALSPDGGWKYLSTGAYAPGDVREIATRISGTLWA